MQNNSVNLYKSVNTLLYIIVEVVNKNEGGGGGGGGVFWAQ